MGTSWESGTSEGDSVPLSQFCIVHAGKDTADTINAALSAGKNLLLTPGIYNLDGPVLVNRADTIILGIGMPTLSPKKGTSAMEIADVSGVKLANVLFDAGTITSPVLLQVGPPGSNASHADDPTLLYDIFARIGGAVVGVAKVAVIYGLFVEHFQENQVLWNGENGRTYFFQSELPYDPPTQGDWQHGAIKGYPAYKVADNVKTHEAWGLGMYCVFKFDSIYCDSAVECPKDSGVKFHNALTFRLGGATDDSGINNVINDQGGASTKKAAKQEVLEYPLAQ